MDECASRTNTALIRDDRLDGLELLSARFRGGAFPLHAHETFVVGVADDPLRVWQGGRWRRVAPGHVFVVGAGELHSGAPVDDVWAYRAIYPHPELVARLVGSRLGLGRLGGAVLARPELGRRIAALVEAAVAAGHVPAACERDLREVLADVLWAPGRRSGGAPVRTLVERGCAFLDARATRGVSVMDLAEHLGVSRSYVSRVFAADLGLTPHAYVLQRRAMEAKRLLAQGRSPAEVAYATGYADQAHLTRHFKRYHGVTPGAYRRACVLAA